MDVSLVLANEMEAEVRACLWRTLLLLSPPEQNAAGPLVPEEDASHVKQSRLEPAVQSFWATHIFINER